MAIWALIFGILTVISASGVIFARRPLNSALCLIATLFLVAVHYALLGAQFVATLQILVYAGAIMVLVIFVIMLLGLEEENTKVSSIVYLFFATAVTAIFIAVVVYASLNFLDFSSPDVLTAQFSGTVEEVGRILFVKMIYPFEIVSVLLLVAILGAVTLAQDKKRTLPKGRGLRAKQGGA